MTTVPKLFTEEVMRILDRENRALWMPAGTPMRKMRPRALPSMRSLLRSSLMDRSVFRSSGTKSRR